MNPSAQNDPSVNGSQAGIVVPTAEESPSINHKDEGSKPLSSPLFILYFGDDQFDEALDHLTVWVDGLLLPAYAREADSGTPWCPEWREHLEAVAQLYGLWMAWQELTGVDAPLTGPAMWHRDYLGPVMQTLRDPKGPFAGCKLERHQPKLLPPLTKRFTNSI